MFKVFAAQAFDVADYDEFNVWNATLVANTMELAEQISRQTAFLGDEGVTRNERLHAIIRERTERPVCRQPRPPYGRHDSAHGENRYSH